MSNHTNTPEQQRAISITLAAQGLIKEWWKGSNLTNTLNNPQAEEMIVEAAAEFLDTDSQEEWIALVRGDGSDPRRVQLAERCAARTLEVRESLRSE